MQFDDQQVGSWTGLLQAIENGERIAYKAPLDYAPRIVRIVRVFKNGKVRVDPLSSDADQFTADHAHLDRFFVRVAR